MDRTSNDWVRNGLGNDVTEQDIYARVCSMNEEVEKYAESRLKEGRPHIIAAMVNAKDVLINNSSKVTFAFTMEEALEINHAFARDGQTWGQTELRFQSPLLCWK